MGERRALAGQLVIQSYIPGIYVSPRFVAVRLCVVKPTRFSRLAENARHLVRSRRSLGVERAARAEAARADG